MGKLKKALIKHLKEEKNINHPRKLVIDEQKSKNPIPNKIIKSLVHLWVSPLSNIRLEVSSIPYSSRSRILLVGEGDFSFAASLVQHHTTLLPIIATTFDSQETVLKKYSNTASVNIQPLSHVLFNVDARSLDSNKSLFKTLHNTWSSLGSNTSTPTRIVFNFPHTGSGIKDKFHNVHDQKTMLLAFFQSLARMYSTHGIENQKLAQSSSIQVNKELVNKAISDPHLLTQNLQSHDNDGVMNWDALDECPEVHITLKSGQPYDDWNIGQLARIASTEHVKFVMNRSFAFDPTRYPGYKHQRTIGFVNEIDGENFENNSRTYIWNIQTTR